MHILERVSTFTGKRHLMEIPLSAEEFNERHDAWQRGGLIQDCFPMLTPAQREFIVTGMSEEEQDFVMNDPHFPFRLWSSLQRITNNAKV